MVNHMYNRRQYRSVESKYRGGVAGNGRKSSSGARGQGESGAEDHMQRKLAHRRWKKTLQIWISP